MRSQKYHHHLRENEGICIFSAMTAKTAFDAYWTYHHNENCSVAKETPEMNSAYQIYLNWLHRKHEYEETKGEQDRLGLKSDL